MVRKENKELTKKIIKILKKYSEGTYVSEISRELNIPKSTVSYVINTRLKDKITNVKVGQKGLFRVIKLNQNL